MGRGSLDEFLEQGDIPPYEILLSFYAIDFPRRRFNWTSLLSLIRKLNREKHLSRVLFYGILSSNGSDYEIALVPRMVDEFVDATR